MSELNVYHHELRHNEYAEFCLKYEVDKVIAEKDKEIAELKDKCQMHNFFWDGCGFAKRGFKNSIAVSEAFDRLEAENAELKRQIEFLKVTHDACGECNKCADGMGKVFDENLNELKQKLESVQASMYADVVDANMENRRLRRALWIARAYRAKEMCQRLLIQGFDPKWEEVERKCLKKAEEYK